QLALVGAAEGARRLRVWNEERAETYRAQRADSLTLDDAQLRQARLVIQGYAADAGIEGSEESIEIESLQAAAATMEQNFLGSARQKIDDIISHIARKNSA